MSSPNQRFTSVAVRCSIAFLLFLLAMGWSGLWLAGRGQFVAGYTWLIGGVAAVAGFWFARPLARQVSAFRRREIVAALSLAVIAMAFNLKQGELILGGWDPGVYLHTAASVAKGGAVKIVDPDLAVLTPLEKEVIARNLFGVAEPFGGMRILPTGETSPSFHHAYPCLMASVWPIGGLRAALWVNPAFHVGSVLLITLLASLLFGRSWGWAAGLLLAVSPAQVWQAGFPTAEMSTQFFLLAASVALVASQRYREGGLFMAVVSSLAFGFALLIRYDTILMLVPVMLLLLAGMPASAFPLRILVMLLVQVFPILHFKHIQDHVAPYYHPVSGMVVPVLIAAVVIVGIWLMLRLLLCRQLEPHMERMDGWLRKAVTAGFVLWLVVAGVVRPILAARPAWIAFLQSSLGEGSPAVSLLAGSDAGNVFHLVAFVGWPAFLLAFAGIVVALWRVDHPVHRALLYAAVASLVVITTHVFNDHFLMWVSRRFVPVIIPLLVLAVTGVLSRIERLGWFRISRAIPFAVVLILAVIPVRGTWYLATHRDWPGLMAWFDDVNEHIPDDVTVFCDQPGFAAPLRYLYDHRSYELHRREPDARQKLADVMKYRLQRGEDVFLFTMQGKIAGAALQFEPVHAFPLESYIVQDTTRWIPSSLKGRGGDFMLFRVTQTP